jgi:hypothetical protein
MDNLRKYYKKCSAIGEACNPYHFSKYPGIYARNQHFLPFLVGNENSKL